MTKTFLTRTEARDFYGLPFRTFDSFLKSPTIRKMEDRMHRADVESLVAICENKDAWGLEYCFTVTGWPPKIINPENAIGTPWEKSSWMPSSDG